MGPRAPLGVPVRNPLLNLRLTSFNERMRPVPVVFLLLAFSPQLTVSLHVRIGVLGMEEVCRFEVCGEWGVDMCRRDVDSCFVVGLQGNVGGIVIGGEVCIGSERTLSDASAGVAAVGASVLLDVERAGACDSVVRQHFGSRGDWSDAVVVVGGGSCIPQRLHRTCVLLWRLPKDPVPLAARNR